MSELIIAHPFLAFLVVIPVAGLGLLIKLGMVYATGRDDPEPPARGPDPPGT